jgi:hypothetical protein
MTSISKIEKRKLSLGDQRVFEIDFVHALCFVLLLWNCKSGFFRQPILDDSIMHHGSGRSEFEIKDVLSRMFHCPFLLFWTYLYTLLHHYTNIYSNIVFGKLFIIRIIFDRIFE